MELCCARGFSAGCFHGGEDPGIGAGYENVVMRVFLLQHGANDFRDLLRRLAPGEDNFGKALPQGAVMIHFGEAEVFEGQVLEALDGRTGCEFSSAHGFQNFQQVRFIHTIQPDEILSLAHRIAAA